jgi:hypothetical protein
MDFGTVNFQVLKQNGFIEVFKRHFQVRAQLVQKLWGSSRAALNWAPHCVQKVILAKGFTKNVLVEWRHAYRSVDKPLIAVHAPSVVDNVHG